MISRRTSNVAKEDVVSRLLYSDSRRSQTCCRSSQVWRRRSQVLPSLSSALPVTLKASRNALQKSQTLLQLTHLSLHSTSSHTLLEASSDQITFCWCFNLCVWRPFWQNQSGIIWRGTNIPLNRGFRILDAIIVLYIGSTVCLLVIISLIWLMKVTIPVKPILCVGNALRCTLLMTFGWMMVDIFDSVDI